jgi:hypothetical protein
MSEKQREIETKPDAAADVMIVWCATYLWHKHHKDAASELLRLLPKERADEIMREI